MGLFWDQNTPAKRLAKPVVLAPIPKNGWKAPVDFPNLSAAKLLSIDTETYDPYLKTMGPGWARGKGHMVGASIATEDGQRWYFPMRHEVCPEQNLDPHHVLSWLRDTLSNPDQDKIGARLIYDLGWLAEEGIQVKGRLWDVQYAESLLTEDSRTALDVLGTKYLGIGKETTELYEWCAHSYGGPIGQEQRANLYRTPPSLAGPYAEMDAVLPIDILQAQWPLLQQEGLLHLFDLECRLIPLFIKMRQLGVRVDIARAEEMQVTISKRMKEVLYDTTKLVGFDVDFWSGASVAKAFDKAGIAYPRTEGGAPSFRKEFLQHTPDPLCKLINEFRELDKLNGTFLQSYILGSHVDGKIHCQFHTLRGMNGGTRSGRLSSSTPNLQNIPSRSDLGKLLRGIFVPDVGHALWRKFDYSQIEYRFLAHFAMGPGSDDIRNAYINDPNTDYHEALRQLIKSACGMEITRSQTKTINFGLTYGMGKALLIHSLGVSKAKGLGLFESYHGGAPFVKYTMDAVMNEAQKKGYVTTILGRRSRFDKWEPKRNNDSQPALSFKHALQKYGDIQRAYTHKGLNRVLQGSSADQLKTAMLHCYESGLFDRIGYPRITVHDELDFSDPGGVDDGFTELKHVMQNCIKLRVPVVAEMSTGIDWGACA